MKRKIILFICLLFMGILASSHVIEQQKNNAIKAYLFQNLDEMMAAIVKIENDLPLNNYQKNIENFDKARFLYKKIEPVISYLSPESETKLNGAAVLESKPHIPNEIKYPTGFQVLESLIVEQSFDVEKIKNEISNINFSASKLKYIIESSTINSSSLLDAIKLNIYRLIGKGLSGFDSPILLNSIKEATYTLEGTKELLNILGQNNSDVTIAIEKSIAYIHEQGYDFNTFNRAIFIKDFLNPLCNELHEYYKLAAIPYDTLFPKLIPANKANMFVEDAFDWTYFAPSDKINLEADHIALGKLLFNDVKLSINETRSCASCHIPNKGFTDGKKVNNSINNNELLSRNTPSLINSAFQPAQFYDKRVAFLEDQIHDVIANPKEMGGIFDTIISKLNKDEYYKTKFKKIFKTKSINERQIKLAIAAYVRSLSGFNSKFDQYMRGNSSAMNSVEQKGFNLFMGKAKCGTCHFIPLFNGTLPPTFHKIEAEIIGVPSDASMKKLDTDEGIYNIYNANFQKFAFKTTSVRNAAITAPYMHNGAFNTLDEVIEFYNIGGGQNLLFDLPFQTLPTDSLLLTEDEKFAIKQFIFALTDTTSFLINK